ncbi:MAG TPA: superoxide dismutase [Fe], partial [Chlorobaculum parvum]|nr:superoxide dismutase [Fe] [Chlorobaculum parvum]
MAYQQPALPYANNALEPHVSANTIGFHYGKHHAAYVKNFNGLIEGTPFDSMTLEEVIL